MFGFVSTGFVVAACCLLLESSTGVAHIPQQKYINVNLKNFGSFDKTFQILDDICNVDKGEHFLKAGASKPLQVCSSGANDKGYGRIKYRTKGNNDWTTSSLLNNDDTINM